MQNLNLHLQILTTSVNSGKLKLIFKIENLYNVHVLEFLILIKLFQNRIKV